MEKLSFRSAVPDDSGLILYFIGELAAYEKMSDEVVATEELLREWLFEKQVAEVIFACESGKEFGLRRNIKQALRDLQNTHCSADSARPFRSKT